MALRTRLSFRVIALPLLGLIGVSHAQPTRNGNQPLLKVGDTWDYRIYQVGTGKLNRTRVELVTEVQEESVRIRKTDSTGEPPTEETVTIRER